MRRRESAASLGAIMKIIENIHFTPRELLISAQSRFGVFACFCGDQEMTMTVLSAGVVYEMTKPGPSSLAM